MELTRTGVSVSEQQAYEDLANAIIVMAAKDYRKALRDDSESGPGRRWSLEKFFRSEYFKILSKADPEVIIETLKAEYEKEAAKECL